MTTNPEPGTSAENAPDASADSSDAVANHGASERVLSPAAQRALAEAEARRQAHKDEALRAEREIGGRGGADPARFGDWEINGRAIDF
ncbi:MAG: DUF1674 domain-containing protein [Hoeflea sp.]|uniref:DUF1674 domain-containing protein n=1 Tax=Hoeflea sp. TaxID=1940281 RepID=UPI001D98C28C|nr:DUF1674 domain-containing protein [Hoeflea sp.]MBU4531797.1 DUF1674 domain-containing protein [Alphaproteobacteria bacterium]MBU4544653.1 DUF1674 domain-containing protein [Alphaproteobacteria bacterium]MBU4552884.1 DUF1674 domain-containing protein [Alphaproteobacteria bacterium]MBV1725073.1 DUF1674 domain-containing protein [Hoeflea sp.]MBV1761093.1 DUF1674 domain-containing protein [Hoeflea sp.]